MAIAEFAWLSETSAQRSPAVVVVLDAVLIVRNETIKSLMVILIAINVDDTDDHLRNPWLSPWPQWLAVSPAFDVNPTPDMAAERSTAVGEVDWTIGATYEVDPQLQFDYPATSDTSLPTTAAMVRAMRAADHERTSGNPAGYKVAVDRFSQTLAAAESAAGVQ